MSHLEPNNVDQRVRRAYERIYREHRQGLYTLALSITARSDRAEDAVQDAFTRLFAGGRKPQGDLVAYAFAAVRNAAIDQQRRHGSEPVALGELIYEDESPGGALDAFSKNSSGPVGMIVAEELQARLRRAISALPAEQARIVLLKIHADLTFEQIAAALQQPMGTVTSRYRRALEKLREELQDD